MSAFESSEQSEYTGSDEITTISTGLENLDQAIERKGLRVGSIVSVLSNSSSPGEVIVANMISNRPAYYYSFGKSTSQIRRDIKNVSNVDMKQVQLQPIEADNPAQHFKKVLESTEFPAGVIVILNPVNELENGDLKDYKVMLRKLHEKMLEVNGLAILYGVADEPVPEHRWITKYTSDVILGVSHTRMEQEIKDELSIEKLYTGQNLVNEDTRVFELNTSLDIDIASSRNISP